MVRLALLQGAAPTAGQEYGDSKDEETDEEQLCDTGSGTGYTPEAKQPGDDSDQKEE